MSRTPFTVTFALLLILTTSACGADTPGDAATPPKEEAGNADDGHGHEEGEGGTDSTVIKAAMAEQSGIVSAPVQAGTIADEHEVQGLLTPVDGRVAQVMARFPGPIRDVRAGVGDTVRAGQVLATIESNLSLTTYTLTSPLTGTVLQRAATVGAVAGEGMS